MNKDGGESLGLLFHLHNVSLCVITCPSPSVGGIPSLVWWVRLAFPTPPRATANNLMSWFMCLRSAWPQNNWPINTITLTVRTSVWLVMGAHVPQPSALDCSASTAVWTHRHCKRMTSLMMTHASLTYGNGNNSKQSGSTFFKKSPHSYLSKAGPLSWI